jgi:hypothetical protein
MIGLICHGFGSLVCCDERGTSISIYRRFGGPAKMKKAKRKIEQVTGFWFFV